MVQSVLRHCTVCKRWEGGPYRMPIMPPYLSNVLVNQSPFHTVENITLAHCMLKKNQDHRKFGSVSLPV